MKKILVFLMILSLLAVSCTKKEANAEAIANESLEKNVIPYAKRYSFSAASYSDMYLTFDRSVALYGCDIRKYCSDFYIALSKKDTVSELHILMALGEAQADHLKNCLEARAEVLKDKEIYMYDTDNAENINAMIYQNGLTVCMSVGQNSEIMYEKLAKLLK